MKLKTFLFESHESDMVFVLDSNPESVTPIYGGRYIDLAEHILSSASAEKAYENLFTQTFFQLKKIWEKDIECTSSVDEIINHPAYEKIIKMGPPMIPLILREMERKPGHWFWALYAITNEDPISPEHRGNIGRMTSDWLLWGISRGYILG